MAIRECRSDDGRLRDSPSHLVHRDLDRGFGQAMAYQLNPDFLPSYQLEEPSTGVPSSLPRRDRSTCGSAGAVPKPLVDDDQPAKRGRRSKPKVKTGCSNCKQRRIKCDEKRPGCTQCTRSHKECSGYPAPSRSVGPFEELRIAPKPMTLRQAAPALTPAPVPLSTSAVNPISRPEAILPPRRVNRRQKHAQLAVLHHHQPQHVPYPPLAAPASSLITYRPSTGIPFEQTEVTYFQLFRSQTAAELSGYFDCTFWTRNVLQECHTEPAVRHATIALGALYKTLEESYQPWHTAPDGAIARRAAVMRHWQVAVKQYSEACNAMVTLIGQSQQTNRIRLMATVLLACFDSFIGDHKQAIIQIQTGLSLLDQVQTEQMQLDPFLSRSEIEPELVVMFTRLAIQAKSYDLAFHFPQPYVVRLAPGHRSRSISPPSDSGTSSTDSPSAAVLPTHFSSVVDARMAFDKIAEAILVLLEQLYAAKEEASNVLPSNWKQYGLGFRSKLEGWREAFDPIFHSRNKPGVSRIEKSAITALKMFHSQTQIIFMMMFCSTEEQFDAFYPHFKMIVDMGLEWVQDAETKAIAEQCPDPSKCPHRKPQSANDATNPEFAAYHMHPSFTADLGIVAPLFVVATKCRDRVLRRQAIQLLRSSARREGMWDSELIAHTAQWIMQVEESEELDAENSAQIFSMTPTAADIPFTPAQFGSTASPVYSPATVSEPIPESRRVMIKSLDFDLRERVAELRIGTREVRHGDYDKRARWTRISW